MSHMKKYVYNFSSSNSEGGVLNNDLLGGKGANLGEMSAIGLPIPPGFTITTEVCSYFFQNDKQYPETLKDEILLSIKSVEQDIKKYFGNNTNPLLFSIRSGAPISMPGMMDSILNLGLNDKTVIGLGDISNDRRFALDSYRRFIQMYGNVVLGIEHEKFEDDIDSRKRSENKILDIEFDEEDLDWIIDAFKDTIERFSGAEFPQDPRIQLWNSISAVFKSWMNPRAIAYRKIKNIPNTLGTGVTIQSMVYGNLNNNSATGIAFTRNPSTGANKIFGEYLVNAQGEDVVAGIRTPFPINKNEHSNDNSLEEIMPEMYTELKALSTRLENHYRDMQDIEFTIENKKLYLLQTRNAQRSAQADVKIAVDLVNESLISEEEALLRVNPSSLEALLHPVLAPNSKKEFFSKGLNASPGAASGVICFSIAEVEAVSETGGKSILIREETSPEDIQGMFISSGLVTIKGGMTSHAAVVARGMGRPCIVGAGKLFIDQEKKTVSNKKIVLKSGDLITIDGFSGEIYLGKLETADPELSNDYLTIMNWADKYRNLQIRSNAETVTDISKALSFGAEGVGLCRTEHMFFEDERIIFIREMIMSDTKQGREIALKKLLNFQRDDFIEIFRLLKEKPITIRLLDLPMHEFLPNSHIEIKEVANALNVGESYAKEKVHQLQESNPMLGHRGVRMAITYPEIYEMQVRAIFEAVVYVKRNNKLKISPEIMIPLVSNSMEIKLVKRLVQRIRNRIEIELGEKINFTLGTMIELPSAAVRGKEISKEVSFFSFGTNDLTQTVLGLSRDDSSKFLNQYVEKKLFEKDPFVSIDIESVGKIVEIGTINGRQGNNSLKIGICGEHGADPESINFFEILGIDYISCSPYKIPLARLAAAQASILLDRK